MFVPRRGRCWKAWFEEVRGWTGAKAEHRHLAFGWVLVFVGEEHHVVDDVELHRCEREIAALDLLRNDRLLVGVRAAAKCCAAARALLAEGERPELESVTGFLRLRLMGGDGVQKPARAVATLSARPDHARGPGDE